MIIPLLTVTLVTANALFLSAAVQWMHFEWKWERTVRWLVRSAGPWVANASLYLAWIGFLCALTARPAAACCIGSVVALIAGFMNSLMLRFRRRPLIPEDLKMAKNFVQIVGMLPPEVEAILIASVLIFGGFAAFLFRAFSPEAVLPTMRVPFSLLFFLLLAGDCLRAKRSVDFSLYGRNSLAAYDDHGYLLAFIAQFTQPLIARPKGYEERTVRAIGRLHTARAREHNAALGPESRPDVLLILSESFYDPMGLPGLSWSADPIRNIRRIMAGTPSGDLLATGYGGGTAQCECEVLTGLSTAMCTDSNLYQSCIGRRERFPSLVSAFRGRGYRAVALHPYNNTMYGRVGAYRTLGFDDFLCQDSMKHRGTIDSNPYVADSEAYTEALELLDRSGAPTLLHLITMQNHASGIKERFRNQFRVTGTDPKTAAALETQAQGLHYTDLATAELLAKLENRERDTVVLFYGDHLPGGVPSRLFDAEPIKRYLTPFFIWSNRGMKPVRYPITSPFYLGGLLKQHLGFRMSPFDLLCGWLYSHVPALHMDFVIGADGREIIPRPDLRTKAKIKKYRMIEYDLIAGERYADDLFDL